MIRVDIRGMAEVQSMLRNLASEQLPYAMMLTLNNVAFGVRTESQKLLESAFDRPTPLIKGATAVQKATKAELTSKTFIDPKRAVILEVHERGTDRGSQKMERFLRTKGWLPQGHYAVPAETMPLDAYGNPRAAEITKIIEGLSSGLVGARTSRSGYFVILPGQRGSLKPGIYLKTTGRSGAGTGNYRTSAIAPLYLFVEQAKYQAMLHWDETMFESAVRIAPDEALKAVRRAIETARG
jgi:hypothetical protein